MSEREVSRAGLLGEVAAGRMRQGRAAELLGLSLRQVKRLVRAYRKEGPASLRSKKRGRPSNRAYADALREQVVALHATHYSDFGPTLFTEHLRTRHAIALSTETVRQWLIQAGRWKVAARRRPIHRPRSRRPRFGELIQIDGSPHDWFEGRAPRCTMIVFIDDATSKVVYARLVPTETSQAYFEGMAVHLGRHGRPLAYYSDRHSIFRVNREDVEAEPTQVERALKALDIELICAHSPQAKGRVERVHQTFQDRFTKLLRLEAISELDAANRRLETYLQEHNQRFAKPAFDPGDAHRPVIHSADELRRILSPHHRRRVDRSGTVQFECKVLQVARSHHRRSVGKPVTVIVNQGVIELWQQGKVLPFTTRDADTWRAEIRDRKALDAHLDRTRKEPRNQSVKPPPSHFWRHDPVGKAAHR
jgi:transposase